jgi:hypothetical protein
MKTGLFTIFAAVGALLLGTVSLADMSIPTTVMVFFQKDEKPYKKPVDFTVRCYGWTSYPGQRGFPPGRKPEPYTPKEVYSFSGSCPDYGCSIRHDLYLNYKHIDYCDLEGKSEGLPFKVEKFGNMPVGTCSGSFKQRCELRLTLPK